MILEYSATNVANFASVLWQDIQDPLTLDANMFRMLGVKPRTMI